MRLEHLGFWISLWWWTTDVSVFTVVGESTEVLGMKSRKYIKDENFMGTDLVITHNSITLDQGFPYVDMACGHIVSHELNPILP